MATPQNHVECKAVEVSASDIPTGPVYPHETRDVESGITKNGFGGLDEKAQFHEISLSPQDSSLEDPTELVEGQKRSLSYAKYKIFFHAFLWLLFTG
jgi:hypothetical protein